MTFKDMTATSWHAIVGWAQGVAHRIVEGAITVATMFITWHAFWWAFDYASDALLLKQDAVGTAAVLGAILTPLTVLQGYVLLKYMERKNEE